MLKVPLVTLMLALTALTFVPSAEAGSCPVRPGGTCNFTCAAGVTISVSASASPSTPVSISGSCGGASAACSGGAGCSGTSPNPTTSAGTGTCTMDPVGLVLDDSAASGSCSAPDPSSDPDCSEEPNIVSELWCEVCPVVVIFSCDVRRQAEERVEQLP